MLRLIANRTAIVVTKSDIMIMMMMMICFNNVYVKWNDDAADDDL